MCDTKTFNFNRYGREVSFTKGQRVYCTYYNEYLGEKDCYHRPIYQMIDKPYKSPQYGSIVGDAGIHKYWLAGGDKMQQYLFVNIPGYLFDKAIPISCIQDADEYKTHMNTFLKENEHRIGEKGYDFESYIALKKSIE